MGLEWLSLPSVVNRCSMTGLTETSKRLEVFWTAYRYLRTATKSHFFKTLDLNPQFLYTGKQAAFSPSTITAAPPGLRLKSTKFCTIFWGFVAIRYTQWV
jgi:hypothetical protein